MAKKRKLDNLDLDMIQCKKDGYGCHYGHWKAMQGEPVKVEKMDELPEGWKFCLWCGKPFKTNHQKQQKYCEIYCQREAAAERARIRHNEKNKRWRAKQKAGATT